MFFGFTDEEKMLQKSVREMFKKRNTTEHVRGFMKEGSISKEMKTLLANQGLLGILDLEDTSEEGKGMVNAILIAQEAGRHLLTYPLNEAMVGLAALKTCKQHNEIIKEVELGEKILTIAWVNVDAKVRKTEDGFVLNGMLKEVPFAKEADYILANVRIAGQGFTPEEEETLVVINTRNSKMSIHNSNSMDETYPLYEVNLLNYPISKADIVKGLGMGKGHALMSKMRQIGALLISAELVGCSERALYETVEYSKQRKQFGVEIGSFQAMKHMAADMYLKVESGKVAVEYAAWALDTDDEEADLSVSIAKSYISNASVEICGDAIQMHGGIGFTWENDMHLYFKRARRSAAVLGNNYFHREKIAKIAIDELKNKQEIESKKAEHVPV